MLVLLVGLSATAALSQRAERGDLSSLGRHERGHLAGLMMALSRLGLGPESRVLIAPQISPIASSSKLAKDLYGQVPSGKPAARQARVSGLCQASHYAGYEAVPPSTRVGQYCTPALNSSVYSGVIGEWTVAGLPSSRHATYIAQWSGLGTGYTNSDPLFQAGTTESFVPSLLSFDPECGWPDVGVVGTCSAFFLETLTPTGREEQRTVGLGPPGQRLYSPRTGDRMLSAVVRQRAHVTVVLADLTEGVWREFRMQASGSKSVSAEWVLEAPCLDSHALAVGLFGQVDYSDAAARVGRKWFPAAALPVATVSIIDRSNQVLARPSLLRAGDAFQVSPVPSIAGGYPRMWSC